MARDPKVVIVMGVTGAGKTTVGGALAASLGWAFFDADDFHSEANVEKMRRREPLTDADRTPWIDTLRDLIARRIADDAPAVLACSALRQAYRTALVPPAVGAGEVAFVYLDVAPELAEQRLRGRPGHFMPVALVESQFATLEEPGDALRVDAALPVDEIVERVRRALGH